mmetsp:Transcript_10183/g.25517  ORF Transcript_10183/g.25517 Transcript_10183/m.25517 type:complete len:244 (+) Transcript_10183:763-1494(+)
MEKWLELVVIPLAAKQSHGPRASWHLPIPCRLYCTSHHRSWKRFRMAEPFWPFEPYCQWQCRHCRALRHSRSREWRILKAGRPQIRKPPLACPSRRRASATKNRFGYNHPQSRFRRIRGRLSRCPPDKPWCQNTLPPTKLARCGRACAKASYPPGLLSAGDPSRGFDCPGRFPVPRGPRIRVECSPRPRPTPYRRLLLDQECFGPTERCFRWRIGLLPRNKFRAAERPCRLPRFREPWRMSTK